MTGDTLIGCDLKKSWHFNPALILYFPATGIKDAPGRWIHWAREITIQKYSLPFSPFDGIWHRNGREESLGVGMAGAHE